MLRKRNGKGFGVERGLRMALGLSVVFTATFFVSTGTPPFPVPRASLAQAADVFVATDGGDSSACGSADAPCRTIQRGLSRVAAGGRVRVRMGRYDEDFLELKSNTALVSEDGPLAAKIFSGNTSAVRFENVSNATLDGFEISADYDQGPDGDGLVRVLDADSVTIRNCSLHDAAHDSDIIKVSGKVSGLLIENVVAFNPGRRNPPNPCGDGPWFQEVIDIYGSDANRGDPPPVRDVVVRGCRLFHTPDKGGDYLIYAKINCENILYENNIFGPSAGGGCGNAAVGVGTSEPGEPDPTDFVVRHAIVRNNVFIGCRGDAALGIKNSRDVWVYNNTFFGNGGPALRSVIELRGNSRALEDINVFNNIFRNNRPEQGGGLFYWVREGGRPTGFFHDFNLHGENVAASNEPYTNERGSLYDIDPQLTAPATDFPLSPMLDQLPLIRNAFTLGDGSPAVDRGLDAVGRSGRPNWKPGVTDQRRDFQGEDRPVGNAWDLGADERPPKIETDTVPPRVVVTSPNGGERFEAGGQLAIAWTSSDDRAVADHVIDLSTDGGASFTVPVASGLAGTAQTFRFQIPTTLTTGRARVRVTARDAAGNMALDVSDRDFIVAGAPPGDTTPPTVRVSSPNGGEKLKGGAMFTAAWTTDDEGTIASHAVALSTDAGTSFSTSLATGLPGAARTFTFVVPQAKTKTGRLQVTATDAAGNLGHDASDGNFQIKAKK